MRVQVMLSWEGLARKMRQKGCQPRNRFDRSVGPNINIASIGPLAVVKEIPRSDCIGASRSSGLIEEPAYLSCAWESIQQGQRNDVDETGSKPCYRGNTRIENVARRYLYVPFSISAFTLGMINNYIFRLNKIKTLRLNKKILTRNLAEKGWWPWHFSWQYFYLEPTTCHNDFLAL